MNNFLRKLFLFFCIGGISVAISAQELAERKVTINMKDALARTVLAQLRVQSGALFAFEETIIDRNSRVTLSHKNAPLEKVVKDFCKQLGLQYVFKKNMVLIFPKEVNVISVSDWVALSGSVLDENGEPMVGVAVYAPMSNLGTVTDVDGKFQLRLKEQELVTFNFIGYQSVSYKVTAALAANPLTVKLSQDNNSLEEVVINGYQSINKGRYVGAITQVNVDDVRIAGELSIDQMLQGAVPGMSVQMNSGQVGTAAKIRVRGTSTLLGNQEPLWVVDGVIQHDPFPMQEGDNALAADADNLKLIAGNCISWLNPNDIETMTVLKDASATAIYGSKAANGVIVITTKRSKASKMSVSYNGTYTIGQKPSYGLYDLMNSQEKMQLSKEIYEEKLKFSGEVTPIGYEQLMAQLQGKQISYDQFVQAFRKYETVNTDWFDLLFRNSFSHSHGVSINGGNQNISTRLSLNYSETKGEAIGNDVNQYSFHSNTSFRFFNNRVLLTVGLSGSQRDAKGFAYGVDPFTYASSTSRTIPAFNEDGTYYYHLKSATSSFLGNNVFSQTGNRYYNYNILNELDNTGSKTSTKNMAVNFDLDVKIGKGFSWKGVYAYSVASSQQKQWATEFSNYITQIRGYNYGDERVQPGSKLESSSYLPHGGLLQTTSMNNRNYTFRNSLVYDQLFNKVHSVTFSLGIEATSEYNEGFSNKKYGYLLNRGQRYASVVPPLYTYGVSAILPTDANKLLEEMRTGSSNTDQENNFLSEYFTGVYSYDGRYVVNFNARVDASNRFGQDAKKKFRPTWSIGAKWRLGNERFMENLPFINALDLSGSYGYQGNSVETVSPYLIAQEGGEFMGTGIYTLQINSLPYPNLGWEKTRTWNVGADVSLLGGRLSFAVNVFNKTSDVLNGNNLPPENGVTTAPVFGTQMRNYGYDLSVSLIPIQTKDFTWQLSMNTGVTHNKVDQDNVVYTIADYINGTALLSGIPYGTLWSFQFNGLDPEDGKPLFKNLEIPSTDDFTQFLVNSGTIEPDFTGGIFTRLSYKGWSLQGNFSVSFGGRKRLPALYSVDGTNYGLPLPEINSSRKLINRWRQPGDENSTIYPSLPTKEKTAVNGNGSLILPLDPSDRYDRYTAYNNSDIRVAESDFIRCRQIALNYQFQRSLLQHIGMNNLQLGISLSNPFLIAFDKKWDGYDPETGGWPARKTVSMTLNASF